MSVAQSVRRNMSLGGRLPPEVGGLLLLTALLSLLAAVAGTFGRQLLERAVLFPARVWTGEVWRVATWVLFEVDPLRFIFGLLMLYLFGRDLSSRYGARRFLLGYFALAIATGVTISLLERLLFPSLGLMGYAGVLSITAGLVIAWALSFPDRQLFVYFVVPLGGMRLVAATLGVTAIFAAFSGLPAVLDEIISEALVLGWLLRGRIVARLRAALPKKKPPRRPPTDFQVWDEEKQRFRPPKWMN